ncbi:MAG: molybdopterin-dependent oxidoreductase [Acidobacteriota bacterium]|nr:molybdopterin-dependent oxidoreductase [Acidobacteriota bacterium]
MATSDGNDHRGHATVDTACPLDCPDSCSLSVTIEHGKLTGIDGSTRQAETNGYICGKVRRFDRRVYSDDRILRPAIRQGPKGQSRPKFKDVTWDEALEQVATRLTEVRERWGGEAILPFSYGGSNGLVSQDTSDAALFRRLGASRLSRTVCAAPTRTAARTLYGEMPSITPSDYTHSQLIVVWGANPSESGIHLVPYIREAQRKGATLVVIDPRQTKLALKADIHLPVRPGTDLPVALALHRHLFEHGLADTTFLDEHARGSERLRLRADAWPIGRAAEVAGIDATALEEVADLYARKSPAVIRCGWGLERNRNGGSAALAVLALPAVAGKFGVRGGGYSMSNLNAWPIDRERWIGAEESPTRAVNMNHLGRALFECQAPPIKALFVYNCNPVATMPDQNAVARGLSRDDLFTVVFDQVRTDTAAYADIILPATTFLETYDVAKGYGPISLQLVQPAIDTVGEARPNVEVFADLAARLGLVDTWSANTEAEALLQITNMMPNEIRIPLHEAGTATPPMGAAPIQFVDVQPRTADKKIELFNEALDDETPEGLYVFQPDPASDDYPLALISPATSRTICSTLGELQSEPAAVEMHVDDAVERDLSNGDTVRLFNDQGEVHCLVKVTDRIRKGTISLPKGLWRKSTLNGSTANALVPDTLTDIGGGACFNDARVQAERVLAASYKGRDVTLTVSAATAPRAH